MHGSAESIANFHTPDSRDARGLTVSRVDGRCFTDFVCRAINFRGRVPIVK